MDDKNKSMSLIQNTSLQIQMNAVRDAGDTSTEPEITNNTAKISQMQADNDISLSEYFSDGFKWLDYILKYYPLWITKTSSKEPRVYMLNYLGLSIAVVSVLLYFALQFFYQITGWYLFSDVDNIIWCGYIVFISLSRLLSIIYSYKYLNCPWKVESLQQTSSLENSFVTDPNTHKKYKKLIVRWKTLNISLVVCYVILDIIVVILETWVLLPYYHDSLFTYIAVKSLCRLCLLYPQLFVVMIQSSILLKYYLCLDQLYIHMKNKSSVDLQYVFEHYTKLYKLFKKDYNKTFQYSVRFYLAAELLFFWDSLNFMGVGGVLFVIAVREVPLFILYFYAAGILEGVHTKFAKQLWKNGNFFLNNKKGCYYNSILHHIQQYPIYLKFGSIVISSKNVTKYSLGLLATRVIIYIVTHWINENY
eukprot:336279_1